MMRKKNRVLGILGNPLKQSMSPMVHNYWIKKYNLDNYYCKFQLEKIDQIKTAIRALNLQGLNVTIPYKKKLYNIWIKLIKQLEDFKQLIP